MAVTGISNNYNAYEGTSISQKSEASKESAGTQAEKTKKSASDKVSDYYSYLSKKYDCVKNGSVAISGSYLQQCANEPEKAKELEENVSLFKDLYKQGYESAKQNAQRLGGRLVNYSESWSIDSKGEITMMSSTTVTVDNGTKSQKEIREEREERLKEKREEAKKAEKIKAQREEEQEQLEKLRERANVKERIYIKENETESDMENDAVVQKNMPEDVFYPRFDVGI